MTVFQLLRADLIRQNQLAGKTGKISTWHVFVSVPHPRVFPLVLVRLSHAAAKAGIPLLPRLFSYANIVLFGLDVASKCEIGPGLFLPHTSGTVIGASRIGSDVTIFQNVTLGAQVADMGWNIHLRPQIGSKVTLGAGCKVLGDIHIADGVTIGANAVVVDSIPPDSVAVGIPARVVASTTTRPKESSEEKQC